MKRASCALFSLLIAAAGLGGASIGTAQDKGKSVAAAPAGKATELNSFLCKDIMRLSGEDRSIAIAVMHGYFLAKRGATSYVSGVMSKIADDFTEYCLDHPNAKAFDTFGKFAK